MERKGLHPVSLGHSGRLSNQWPQRTTVAFLGSSEACGEVSTGSCVSPEPCNGSERWCAWRAAGRLRIQRASGMIFNYPSETQTHPISPSSASETTTDSTPSTLPPHPPTLLRSCFFQAYSPHTIIRLLTSLPTCEASLLLAFRTSTGKILLPSLNHHQPTQMTSGNGLP